MRQRRMVSLRGGQGGFANRPYGGGESRLGGGNAPSGGMDFCLRRKDGWEVAVWDRPRSTLRGPPASADLRQDERLLTGMEGRGERREGARPRFLAGPRDDRVKGIEMARLGGWVEGHRLAD